MVSHHLALGLFSSSRLLHRPCLLTKLCTKLVSTLSVTFGFPRRGVPHCLLVLSIRERSDIERMFSSLHKSRVLGNIEPRDMSPFLLSLHFMLAQNGLVEDPDTNARTGHMGLGAAAQSTHSMLDMFQTHFPDAFLHNLSHHSVQPLPLSSTPFESQVHIISAPKGMGKSKAIHKALGQLSPITSIVHVTFRRVLARSVIGTSYLDCSPDAPLNALRLTVLINSLWRVDRTYDVVVLDEWVSILEMLSSDLIRPTLRLSLLAKLLHLIRHANLIIVADALLDSFSLAMVNHLLHDKTPAIHGWIYTHQVHANHTYVWYDSPSSWETALQHAIASGRNVVIPCMTRSKALELGTKLNHLTSSMLVYVADSVHDLEDHMTRIHEVWEVQVLIYSPVITAGCSFESKHFSDCFLYAFQGTASVRSALQMSFRVRDLSSKRIHVVIDGSKEFTGQVEATSIPRPCAQHSSPLIQLCRTLFMQKARQDTERCRAFQMSFWQMIKTMGCKVECFDGTPIVSPDHRWSPIVPLAVASPQSHVRTLASFSPRPVAKHHLTPAHLIDQGLIAPSAKVRRVTFDRSHPRFPPASCATVDEEYVTHGFALMMGILLAADHCESRSPKQFCAPGLNMLREEERTAWSTSLLYDIWPIAAQDCFQTFLPHRDELNVRQQNDLFTLLSFASSRWKKWFSLQSKVYLFPCRVMDGWTPTTIHFVTEHADGSCTAGMWGDSEKTGLETISRCVLAAQSVSSVLPCTPTRVMVGNWCATDFLTVPIHHPLSHCSVRMPWLVRLPYCIAFQHGEFWDPCTDTTTVLPPKKASIVVTWGEADALPPSPSLVVDLKRLLSQKVRKPFAFDDFRPTNWVRFAQLRTTLGNLLALYISLVEDKVILYLSPQVPEKAGPIYLDIFTELLIS